MASIGILLHILDIIAADVVNIDGAAMRGTDSALLAASAPTNFGDLSISVTTGLVSLLAATQASIDAIEADTSDAILGITYPISLAGAEMWAVPAHEMPVANVAEFEKSIRG